MMDSPTLQDGPAERASKTSVGGEVGGAQGHAEARATAEAISPAGPDEVSDVLRSSARHIKRRGFFSDGPDKWLFLLFAAAGFAMTLIVKFMGVGGLLSALPAVLALIAYAVVSSSIQWFKLPPDRLGDNCYYMGFIFTLASLSVALVEIQNRSGDARNALLEGLIGSFGVALFSTILGIILRVFFMQMRHEIEDVEEVIRNELQDAAQLLKDQLGKAVEELDIFRLRTQQVMNEQFENAASEFARVSFKLAEQVSTAGATQAAASDRLALMLEEAASKLAQAASSMTAQVLAAGMAHQQAATQLAGSSKTVVTEVGRLVQRIDRIDVPSDLLTRQVNDARQRISDIATAMEGSMATDVNRQAAIARASASLEVLLKRLSELPAFDAIEQSVGRLRSATEDAAGAVRGIGDQLASQNRAYAALVASAERDSAAIATARAAVEADLAQSTTALHKLQGTLADVAESLVQQLGAA